MIKNPFSLEGKKILITGASSGIGRSVAELASSMGAVCAINGRDENKLNLAMENMTGDGHVVLPFDLSQANAQKTR